jgi:ATP-dependent DNA helicase RecG
VKIIELIEDNPSITRTEIAEITGLSIEGIDKNIRQMKKEGLLKRIGPDNGGYWEIDNDNEDLSDNV